MDRAEGYGVVAVAQGAEWYALLFQDVPRAQGVGEGDVGEGGGSQRVEEVHVCAVARRIEDVGAV